MCGDKLIFSLQGNNLVKCEVFVVSSHWVKQMLNARGYVMKIKVVYLQ